MLKSGYAKKNEQTNLRKKFGIEKESVTVKIENPFKQILELVWSILKVSLRVLLIVLIGILATVGLTALVYPAPRAEITNTFTRIFMEFRRMLGV
jgi:hypothetical protein